MDWWDIYFTEHCFDWENRFKDREQGLRGLAVLLYRLRVSKHFADYDDFA